VRELPEGDAKHHLYPPARPLLFRDGTKELYIHLIGSVRRNDLLVTYRLSSTRGATVTGVTVSKCLIIDHLLGSLCSIEHSVTKCTCLTKSDTANNLFLFINRETTLSQPILNSTTIRFPKQRLINRLPQGRPVRLVLRHDNRPVIQLASDDLLPHGLSGFS
jgi:hypothetical protein